MQWVLKLETEKELITTCRLMNIFRRKGVTILKLELEAAASSFAVTALVETRESDVPHLFNFLRRTEGVYRVTCDRPAAAGTEREAGGMGTVLSAEPGDGDGLGALPFAALKGKLAVPPGQVVR